MPITFDPVPVNSAATLHAFVRLALMSGIACLIAARVELPENEFWRIVESLNVDGMRL
jgi:hypothetical protein